MPRKSTLPPDAPVWLTEDRRIDEMTFCCSFLEAHPMKCVHGKLYTVDGLISDEAALKREIFMEICDWVKLRPARMMSPLYWSSNCRASGGMPQMSCPRCRRCKISV
jgi:putative DNA primase/helicase